MAANTTFGRLAADLTNEYQARYAALYTHADLINRFGAALAPLGLSPHFVPAPGDAITLRAVSTRGTEHGTLLKALADAGYHASSAEKSHIQFNDGHEMWTASCHGNGFNFTLLFYVSTSAIAAA